MGERLKRVEQGAKEVWPYLKWVLFVLAIPGLYYLGYWLLVTVPEQQVSGWLILDEAISPKDRAHTVDEARKTLAQIAGGLLAVFGAIFAFYLHHRRVTAMERQVLLIQEQVRVAQEGQVTERFTRAIEHLGDDRLEVRLGGIYALERIARDSEKDHWTIMEVLTAYVRQRAPWKEAPAPPSTSGAEAEPPAEPGPSLPKPPLDIQAILTVIGRRTRFFGQGETEHLDLRGTDLRGADLGETHLEGADLGGALLEEGNLSGAWGLTREQLAQAYTDGQTIPPDYLKETGSGAPQAEE